MRRYLVVLVSMVVVLAIGWVSPVSAETKPEKAAAAHQRALSAFSSGNLEEATSEAVMASTLDPKALYFFTAARLYFSQDELALAAMYVQKAAASQGETEKAALDAKKKLVIAVAKREKAILAGLSQVCPPVVKREDLLALQAIVPESGARLLEALDVQQTCFLAEFPELPEPVKVVQEGIESVPVEKGVFIVRPGKVEVYSVDHPPLAMDVSGEPGTRVAFRPRGEPWMQAQVSLKGVPPRADFLLNGERVEATDDSLTVAPKEEHRLVVSAPGRQRFKSDRFSLPFGGAATVEVRAHKKRSWIPWVLMGVGAVGAGLGGYFMYDGSATASEYEGGLERNDRGFVSNAGRKDAMASQKRANTVWNGGMAGVIAGGTFILSGVIWAILEDTTPPEWRD